MIRRREPPGFNADPDEPADQTEVVPGQTASWFRENDERFQAAMSAAVAAGREHPPMIGVDKTPGTHKAIRMEARNSNAYRSKDNQ